MLIDAPNDILNRGAGADTFVFLPNFDAVGNTGIASLTFTLVVLTVINSEWVDQPDRDCKPSLLAPSPR